MCSQGYEKVSSSKSSPMARRERDESRHNNSVSMYTAYTQARFTTVSRAIWFHKSQFSLWNSKSESQEPLQTQISRAHTADNQSFQ